MIGRSQKKQDSCSAAWLIQVNVDVVSQEDNGILRSSFGLEGKLEQVQVWFCHLSELQGLHDGDVKATRLESLNSLGCGVIGTAGITIRNYCCTDYCSSCDFLLWRPKYSVCVCPNLLL